MDVECGFFSYLSRSLPGNLPRFGEGLAQLGDRLFQLTWQSGVGYVYELETLVLADSFEYAGEGWGLTSDGSSLIVSDGTPVLRFLDGTTYEVTRELRVMDGGSPLSQISEGSGCESVNARARNSTWVSYTDSANKSVTELSPMANTKVISAIRRILRSCNPHRDRCRGNPDRLRCRGHGCGRGNRT